MYETEEQEREESLIYYYEKLLFGVWTYIEARHLPAYYNTFLTEIAPSYKTERKLLTLKDKGTEQKGGNPVDFSEIHTANTILMIGKIRNRVDKAA